MESSIYVYYNTQPDILKQHICINELTGIFTSDSLPVVGVDVNLYRGKKRKTLEIECKFKAFEVAQKNFREFIYLSRFNNVIIKSIDFMSELDELEYDELNEYIVTKDIDKVIDFIDYQRYELGNDIYDIKFILCSDSSKLGFVSFCVNGAVIIETTNKDMLINIFFSNPMNILYGVRNGIGDLIYG